MKAKGLFLLVTFLSPFLLAINGSAQPANSGKKVEETLKIIRVKIDDTKSLANKFAETVKQIKNASSKEDLASWSKDGATLTREYPALLGYLNDGIIQSQEIKEKADALVKDADSVDLGFADPGTRKKVAKQINSSLDVMQANVEGFRGVLGDSKIAKQVQDQLGAGQKILENYNRASELNNKVKESEESFRERERSKDFDLFKEGMTLYSLYAELQNSQIILLKSYITLYAMQAAKNAGVFQQLRGLVKPEEFKGMTTQLLAQNWDLKDILNDVFALIGQIQNSPIISGFPEDVKQAFITSIQMLRKGEDPR